MTIWHLSDYCLTTTWPPSFESHRCACINMTTKSLKNWLKSVHFKKPVMRSSFFSKSVVIFVVAILKIGLNRTSRPVRKSGKSWNVRIPDFRFFSFPDSRPFNIEKNPKKISKFFFQKFFFQFWKKNIEIFFFIIGFVITN